jgi:predicted secreted protein
VIQTKSADRSASCLERAVTLVVGGTDIPQSVQSEILERLRTGQHVSPALEGLTWSWPWFDQTLKKLLALGKWPNAWFDLAEGPPISPGLSEAEQFNQEVVSLPVTELRELARSKGPLPSPRPKRREEWVELVRTACSYADVATQIEAQREAARNEWEDSLRRTRAHLLSETIKKVSEHLSALDEALENNRGVVPDRNDRYWRESLEKLVADARWEEERPFVLLASRFNVGKISTLPPYFPGDETEVEAVNQAPEEGRAPERIRTPPWEPLDLDFAGMLARAGGKGEASPDQGDYPGSDPNDASGPLTLEGKLWMSLESGQDPEPLKSYASLCTSTSVGMRSGVADAMRRFTRRVRRTVSGKAFSMLAPDQDPEVFRILERLSTDSAVEPRMKAAYALGDHPGSASRAMLERLCCDQDTRVRAAAAHAISRLDEFAQIETEYRRALELKAGS